MFEFLILNGIINKNRKVNEMFLRAPEIPYYKTQCPNCMFFSKGQTVAQSRCKGFITKDAMFGDMFGTFRGESEGSCPKFQQQ